MDNFDSLARLIQALSPWRAHLVFIGGWAHRLHRFSPLANQPEHQPLFTRDTDLALGNKSPIEGDIKAALLGHGFKEQLSGEHNPAVAHYALGDEDAGFYAEFLTPLVGSGIRRSGAIDATMSIAGITAQKIRHLDILLVDPWLITVDPEHGIPIPAATDIYVANPLCFMVQKFLIQRDRPPAKRAQDVLYIFDTIELFGANLEQFRQSWNTVVAPKLGEKSSETVQRQCQETFGKLNDVVRQAARIPADRKLTPEQIQQTCQYAFDEILGIK